MPFFVRLSVYVVAVGCLGGCGTWEPAAEPISLDWEIVDRVGYQTKACLSESDVAKLRELMIRCKGNPNLP